MSEDNTQAARQIVLVQRVDELTAQLTYVTGNLDPSLFGHEVITKIRRLLDELNVQSVELDRRTYKFLD